MQATEFELKYEICSENPQGIPAVIVAAGISERMQGVDKQTMLLCGIPVIAHTLMSFQKSPDISRIILVARKDEILNMQQICEKYMINKVSDIVVGGATRHESVMCGISRIGSECSVLIHDGARPFADARVIGQTAGALCEFDAAVCAVKVNDTVKFVNEDLTVGKTLDRTGLYLAQTPQGVNVKAYLEACALCKNPDCFTDDVSIMEAAGKSVKVVEGSLFNIKITTPNDIALAKVILEGGSVL